MQTAIIVGASSGIGRELDRFLSAKGFHLGLAARRIDLLVGLEKKLPNACSSRVTLTLSERWEMMTLKSLEKLKRR